MSAGLVLLVAAACSANPVGTGSPSETHSTPVPGSATSGSEPPAPRSATTPAQLSFASVVVPGGIKQMVVRLVGDPTVFDDYRGATTSELERLATGVPAEDIALVRADDRHVLLAWAGGACDVGGTLSVDVSSLVLRVDARTACDGLGITKGVVLRPVSQLDPAQLRVTLVRARLLP